MFHRVQASSSPGTPAFSAQSLSSSRLLSISFARAELLTSSDGSLDRRSHPPYQCSGKEINPKR